MNSLTIPSAPAALWRCSLFEHASTSSSVNSFSSSTFATSAFDVSSSFWAHASTSFLNAWPKASFSEDFPFSLFQFHRYLQVYADAFWKRRGHEPKIPGMYAEV
ncbi:unnamed protein product, partial [Ectocarpus sp. 12 AP-2014]